MKISYAILALLLIHSSANAELKYSDIGKVIVLKSEYIDIIRKKAIDICEINAADYNFKKSKCPNYVNTKSPICVSDIDLKIPSRITNHSQVDEFTKAYWLCATPEPRLSAKDLVNALNKRRQSD
jgi:hypothetical protein